MFAVGRPLRPEHGESQKFVFMCLFSPYPPIQKILLTFSNSKYRNYFELDLYYSYTIVSACPRSVCRFQQITVTLHNCNHLFSNSLEFGLEHRYLQFPNAVVLNAVGRRNTQMRARESNAPRCGSGPKCRLEDPPRPPL